MLFTLGITGGIGSGKTTVCYLLRDLGARIFFADSEAKRLMVEDPEARSEIIEAFGEESYTEAGALNRAYLAAQVFGDSDKLALLNRIVHPRVRDAFETACQDAEADGITLMVEEAALIFETGADRFLDAVAVVDAPLEARIERVTRRDGLTPEQVLARVNHQLPTIELRRRADYIIENNGSLDDLRLQVEALYQTLTQPDTSAHGHQNHPANTNPRTER